MSFCMALLAESVAVDLDLWFAEAEGRTGIKREAVAHMMGISASQLAQQLHRHGHVSFGRIVAMWSHPDPDGKRFVQCLFTVAHERLGFGELDPFTDALLTATVTLTAKFRQVKAVLADVQKRGAA